MSTGKPSRNPFVASAQQSIGDVIALVSADSTLPKTTRQNWAWALRFLCRVCGKDPASIPAHPDYLRCLLKKAAPTASGLTAAAWNNARSLAGKALAWAGITTVPGRYYQTPYTDEWAALWSKLPAETALAYQLSRFCHYASATGLTAMEVNDPVLEQFHQALIEESMVENPWATYRGAAKSWNNAVDRIPGWPQIRLKVPTKQAAVFTLSWEVLPHPLRAEINRYFERAAGVDLNGDFARPQRPQTIETRREQLLWFFSAVVNSGTPIDSLTSIKSLLVPETAKRGLTYLLNRRGGKNYCALWCLAQFLPTLARRTGLPADTIQALLRYKRALRIEQAGMAERHRETLRKFNDPASVLALVGFADRIERNVAACGNHGARVAKLIQTALAVDLLLYAPVRIGNLATIELDRHLIVVQNEPRAVHLRFPAHEVKNNQDLEFPLPRETIALLDLYLTTYRPLLTRYQSSFLFPGKYAGRAKHVNALRKQIHDTVFKFTALDMPPHRFRHAVGKIFLDRNPGQYGVVQRLLGHKRVETTIAFYAGEEGAAAARHYHETILKLRASGVGGSRG